MSERSRFDVDPYQRLESIPLETSLKKTQLPTKTDVGNSSQVVISKGNSRADPMVNHDTSEEKQQDLHELKTTVIANNLDGVRSEGGGTVVQPVTSACLSPAKNGSTW